MIINPFRVAIPVLVAYCVVLVFSYFQQKNYIYFPDKQDFESCPGFARSEKLDLWGTRVYFTKNFDRFLVFYHGNAGSACDRAFLNDFFFELGYSTLFVEYAGYSNDSRKPARDLLLADAVHVDEFLKTQSYSELVLAGESLGAALAVYHSSLREDSRLMLFSAFDRLSNVAKHHYYLFPIRLLLREHYDAESWLKKTRDALVVHGEKDEIVPLKYGQALYEKIPGFDKRFVAIFGAGHNDLYDFSEFYQVVREFLLAPK